MRVFAGYVQRCRIEYGTSAPKTVMQFFNVMNIIWTRYHDFARFVLFCFELLRTLRAVNSYGSSAKLEIISTASFRIIGLTHHNTFTPFLHLVPFYRKWLCLLTGNWRGGWQIMEGYGGWTWGRLLSVLTIVPLLSDTICSYKIFQYMNNQRTTSPL